MISNEAPASKYASAHSESPCCAKWHYMHFVIAALGITAVSASLSFSREIIVDFSDAVHVNRLLVQRQGHYPSMSELAFDVEQLAKRSAEADQIEAALTGLVDECRRAIVGVRGTIASGPVVDSARLAVSVDSESAVVSVGFVQDEEQSATRATVHQQVSEAVQSAVGNPLGKIAVRIDSLDDPNVESQQLSAARMSLTSVLGNTTTTNTHAADAVS